MLTSKQLSDVELTGNEWDLGHAALLDEFLRVVFQEYAVRVGPVRDVQSLDTRHTWLRVAYHVAHLEGDDRGRLVHRRLDIIC